MDNLENKIASYLKNTYSKEWPTMINNIVSAGISTGVTALTTYIAKKYFDVSSDEALTSISTVTDFGTYYSALFLQFAYRDRSDLKDENNRPNNSKIQKKIMEYASYFGILTATYTGARMITQYTLQKLGVDPVQASSITQISLTAIFTGLLPPLRYSIRNILPRNNNL